MLEKEQYERLVEQLKIINKKISLLNNDLRCAQNTVKSVFSLDNVGLKEKEFCSIRNSLSKIVSVLSNDIIPSINTEFMDKGN